MNYGQFIPFTFFKDKINMLCSFHSAWVCFRDNIIVEPTVNKAVLKNKYYS